MKIQIYSSIIKIVNFNLKIKENNTMKIIRNSLNHLILKTKGNLYNNKSIKPYNKVKICKSIAIMLKIKVKF